MTVTLDTSTSSLASAYSNQRKTAVTSTGRVWDCFYNGSAAEFWYSDDERATWTQNTSATISGASDGCLFIDADDHAHFTYTASGNVDYRRMASIDTSTSWGAAENIDGGQAGTWGRPSVWAHGEGTGWVAHVGFGGRNGSGQPTGWYARVVVASDGSLSVSKSVVLTEAAASSDVWIELDGYHTGDGKTVQGSTPHIFLVGGFAGVSGSGGGLRFRKVTYSGGTWTVGTERALDEGGFVNTGTFSMFFDGTRTVIGYVSSADSTVAKLAERDAADTVTTARTPTALSDGDITALAVAYDTQSDIHLWAVGTTSDDVKRIAYDRSAGTWDGSWTTVATTTAIAGTLTLRRGSPRNRIDATYTAGTASPYNVETETVTVNLPPTAPTWDLTNNQAHDVASSLVLDWTFNDPDDGDTQSKYALSRQIGSATIEYWDAGTSSWGATEVENTSSTSSVTLASSWGADGDANHKYAVKTWDAAGLEGSYSSELTVIPSAKDNPTISSPADASTLTTASVTVEWSATTQTAYKARLLSSADVEIESSGWQTSTATSHAFSKTLTNSTTYKVEVTTKNDEGLASTADTNSFSTSFTPPSTPTLVATGSAANGTVTVAITNPGAGATETSNDVYVRVASGGRADLDIPVGGDGLRFATGVAVGGSAIFYPASGKAYEFLVRAHADNSTSADSAWT